MVSRRFECGAGEPTLGAFVIAGPRWRRALAAAAALALATLGSLGSASAAPPPKVHAPEAADHSGAVAKAAGDPKQAEVKPKGAKAKAKNKKKTRPAKKANKKASKAERTEKAKAERTGKKGRRAGAAEGSSDDKAPPPKGKATKKEKKDKREKKTASRRAPSKRRGGKKGKEAPARPCLGPAIQIDRGGLEAQTLSLVDCAGKPREPARRALSVLARPWGAARPAELPATPKAPRGKKGAAPASAEIAPGVRLLDPGLLSRIHLLSRKYPGKAVSLVSGYRPQSRGSLHQSARAVDMRIAGVRNEDLVAACRALPDTGCGYYPNSSFVHVDVRLPGTGGVTWIDASGPGEAPRYVSTWPPPADEDNERAEVASAAGADGAAEKHHAGSPKDNPSPKDNVAAPKDSGTSLKDNATSPKDNVAAPKDSGAAADHDEEPAEGAPGPEDAQGDPGEDDSPPLPETPSSADTD